MQSLIQHAIELRELLTSHSLFTVGILLITGYLMGKLVSLIKLPEITGYILAGLLMGDSVFAVVHHEMSESLKIVTDVALGLIALTIGGEFYITKLKRMGKEVVIMTLFQIVLTFGAVSAGLLIFNVDLPFALLMGAIATATAPAATVAIVQSLRARGKFVDYLYGVVALDDAGCVVVFGFSFAIAAGMLSPESAEGIGMILFAFMEIFGSLLLGALTGYLISRFSARRSNANEIMIIILGFIFLETALSIVFHLSPLLSNMAAGTVIINMSPKNHKLFRIIEPLTPPIYALFFVIAGTELNLSVLLQKEILLIGAVFIIARSIAKYTGIYLGAKASKAPENVKKYLGFAMLPQAGVSIGLVLMIQASPVLKSLPPIHQDTISMMVNVILLAVFFNELTGPPISKFALVRAMEMEE